MIKGDRFNIIIVHFYLIMSDLLGSFETPLPSPLKSDIKIMDAPLPKIESRKVN